MDALMKYIDSEPRRVRVFAAIFLAALSVALYANTLANGFAADDTQQLLENPWVKDLGSLPKVFVHHVWAFKDASASNYYRPMMYVAYILEYAVFGFNPWGWHLVNILLNAAVAALVFIVVLKALEEGGGKACRSGAVIAAFLGALLMTAHPIRTEAAAWVGGMPELLFTVFGLLALYFHMAGGVARCGLAAGFFLLSLFSKETAVVFLPLIFAYDRVFKRGVPLKNYLPYAAVFIFYFAVRLNVLGAVAPLKRHAELTGYEAAINAFPLFAGYFKAFFLPVGQSIFHVFHPVHSLLEAKALASFVFTLAYGAAIVASSGALRLGLIWAALPLLPVMYVPALAINAFAERYLYLSGAGLALVIAGLILKARLSKAFVFTAAAVIAVGASLVFSAATIARNFTWKDDITLWQDAVKKGADGSVPRNEFGTALYNAGRIAEAETEFTEAVRLDPKNYLAHNNLGVIYYRSGRIEAAVAEFRSAAAIFPGYVDAHYNLGVAYSTAGLRKESLAEFNEAERLKAGR